MIFRDSVVQYDLVWRRIIVWDAETINGIEGGMVGRRYFGVPRAFISLYPDQGFRRL